MDSNEIKLEGSTNVRYTYTSGEKGGTISFNLVGYDADEAVRFEFDEPDGVEIYYVSGCIEFEKEWNLLKTSYGGQRHISFSFRRDGTRDKIVKQEITVFCYIDDKCVDELTFKIEG
jgi:hypothetical protein